MAKGIVGIVVAGLTILIAVAHLQADESAKPDKNAELKAAASAAYEAANFDFRNSRCVVDEVYVWSRRLMEAEQGTNANAAADHCDRMRNLNAFVLQLQKKRPELVKRTLLATKYYVLESEANQAPK